MVRALARPDCLQGHQDGDNQARRRKSDAGDAGARWRGWAAHNEARQMSPKFSPSAKLLDVYDYFEVTIETGVPIEDPFRTVSVTGVFQATDGPSVTVDGFCDAPDGSVYRVRFLPTRPALYD